MRALLATVLVLVPSSSHAQVDLTGLGVHAGVGTDIELGLAVGGGVSYAFDVGMLVLEVGPDIFYHNSTEVTEELVGSSNNTYEDETWLTVFGLKANSLIAYDPDELGVYYVLGIGLGVVFVEWEGRSTDDPSYNDSGDGTTAATIINVGIGLTFGGGLDLRFEIPVLFAFDGPGGDTTVVPAFTFVAGYRF